MDRIADSMPLSGRFCPVRGQRPVALELGRQRVRLEERATAGHARDVRLGWMIGALTIGCVRDHRAM